MTVNGYFEKLKVCNGNYTDNTKQFMYVKTLKCLSTLIVHIYIQLY